MELAHVCARPNVVFRHADIFSAQLPALVRREAEGAAVCIAVGMHLCGPLSPRLIDLAFAVDAIDVLLLCPCCLKGGHGKAVAVTAKERGCDPYELLIDTLRAICEREIVSERSAAAPVAPDEDGGAPRPCVQIVVDKEMLSPRNVFLAVRKRRQLQRKLADGSVASSGNLTHEPPPVPEAEVACPVNADRASNGAPPRCEPCV